MGLIKMKECRKCPSTVCVDSPFGRIKDTNGTKLPKDLKRIEILTTKVENCEHLQDTKNEP